MPQPSKKPELNKALICKTVKHIEAHLKQFYMQCWIRSDAKGNKQMQDTNYCGTQACFGGWAALLSVPKKEVTDILMYKRPEGWYQQNALEIQETAKAALGLTEDEIFLFHGVAGSPEHQLEVVKDRLNAIFEHRGEPERFEVNQALLNE